MKKKLLKAILIVFVVIYIIYSPSAFGILNSELLINKKENIDYQIMELWNVDTFEGGSNSRASFLEKCAIQYEKNNKGKFFIIKNYTPQQALNKLSQNNIPSMISFGMGFGKSIKNYLIKMKNHNVRSDLMECGRLNNVTFAVPYILGGYSLIYSGDEIDNVTVFNSEYISPTEAIKYLNLTKISQSNLGSFDVYDGYVNQKYSCILGTQRDVYRCNNRNKNGKGNNKFKYIEGYSDLLQFIGITSYEWQEECENFVDFILSDTCQNALTQINMFNVLRCNYYTDELYRDFEISLNKKLETRNAFE